MTFLLAAALLLLGAWRYLRHGERSHAAAIRLDAHANATLQDALAVFGAADDLLADARACTGEWAA